MATTARPSAPGRITQASEVQQLLDLIRQRNIEVVDVKFCDLPGTWQHFSIPAATLDEAMCREGLGFDGVNDVRAGKLIELDLADGTEDAAIEDMCRKLLANTVIENFKIERLG